MTRAIRRSLVEKGVGSSAAAIIGGVGIISVLIAATGGQRWASRPASLTH